MDVEAEDFLEEYYGDREGSICPPRRQGDANRTGYRTIICGTVHPTELSLAESTPRYEIARTSISLAPSFPSAVEMSERLNRLNGCGLTLMRYIRPPR